MQDREREYNFIFMYILCLWFLLLYALRILIERFHLKIIHITKIDYVAEYSMAISALIFFSLLCLE